MAEHVTLYFLKVDQIHEEIGLSKGSLTDNEIATKVVREFFEALVAKDYKKAGMVYSGIPAEEMKELFGPCNFLRIVEMGKPAPAPNPKMQALQVKVKVECEVNGEKTVRPFSPFVRQVHSQPDRYKIIGGI
ncbi:MAG: hypothetical protein ABSG53_20705 [Thermoguttaceae bacterium]